jgi:hypothetical protein
MPFTARATGWRARAAEVFKPTKEMSKCVV